MGRRSLAAERRQQVLEAASRCLARNGLAGTTLEKIAEESGLSRSHVRHYVGNRDDLLLALVDWVQERDDRAFAAAVEEAPPSSGSRWRWTTFSGPGSWVRATRAR